MMTRTRSWLPAGTFLASLCFSLASHAATVSLPGGAAVESTARWQPSGIKYSNAIQLVATRVMSGRAADGKEFEGETHEASVLFSVEPRTSHADALKRLQDIAASRPEPARFLEIGGWPAVELAYIEAEAQRGKDPGEGRATQKAITAIAMDDKVQRFDIVLAPDADLALLKEAQELARSAKLPKRADPAKTRESLRKLSTDALKRLEAKPPVRGGGAPAAVAAGAAQPSPTMTGTPVLVQNNRGELEVATSADAMNVVIASNQALAFSSNRAATFAAGNTGVFPLNDPSLARGASNNFYLGVIAFPNGTAAQLNGNGCTNAVSRSTDNGATFAAQGFSAQCPLNNPGICFPDQEHIASDSRTQTAANNDQLYAVWRNFTPTAAVASCRNITSGIPTSSITCSQDNGVTWTATAAIAGAGDFPRVAVGRDGFVYVTSVSGNSVLLNKFQSCANGLGAVAGFPVTVAVMTGGVLCPVSGLDRCNSGNTLSSPTPAPDPNDANHLFVAFAERDNLGGERVVVAESRNAGLTFPRTTNISSATVSARRFMPWGCSTRGNAYVGWYDRSAAAAAGAATNDLTEYMLGSASSLTSGLTPGFIRNLSGTPDPQCASGWPCVPRATTDSESCTVQPQAAGICLNAMGGGSQARCDFSAVGTCPPGELCRTGGGCPKYGDYNGIACAGDWVIAAWTSATTPTNAPAGAGLRVFASAEFVGRKHFACEFRVNGCPTPVKFDKDLIVVNCLTLPCTIRDPVPKNCLVKWSCPGCPPNGLCPPWYHFVFDETIQPWKVDLVDGRFHEVPYTMRKIGKNTVLSMRPERDAFKSGEIGDYQLLFTAGPGIKAKVDYKIRAKLLVSDKPVPELPR